MTRKACFCINQANFKQAKEEQAKVGRTEILVHDNKKIRNDSQVLRYSKHTKIIIPFCVLHIPQVMSRRSIEILNQSHKQVLCSPLISLKYPLTWVGSQVSSSVALWINHQVSYNLCRPLGVSLCKVLVKPYVILM